LDKLSYRTKFLLIYAISITFILLLVTYIFNYSKLSDVGSVSSKNLNSSYSMIEKEFTTFFAPYYLAIKSINENQTFINYIDTNENKKNVQELFLSIKKLLPCSMQVRYLDINGVERIRIEGNPVQLFKDKAISKISEDEKLQDKSKRYYVQNFLKLDKNQIDISNIDLNMENGKIEIPKKPTIRFGMSVFNSKKEKTGILVINVCLRTLFKNLNNNVLYNVYIIDQKGRFLLNKDIQNSILGSDFEEYTIKDHFENYKAILKGEKKSQSKYLVKNIENFNDQNLKMIVEIKHYNLTQDKTNTQDKIIIIILILAIIFLPIVLSLSKVPDILIKKSQKASLQNKLTGLSNRIALIEDLKNNIFKDDIIIILLSINNIVKIQNTYGHDIANKLILKLSDYFSSYENNSIKKVYMTGYNIFALSYQFEKKDILDEFLENLISNIEQQPFLVEEANMEFILNITVGVSDPFHINDNIDRLQEAENALDRAMENKMIIDIYDSTHENINKNKENILLAKKIKRAIDENSIGVYFQPIYNNLTDKIEKYECLIRLINDESIIYPDQFLPIAKEINKYNALTYIVIEKAFDYFKDKDYEFSINLSILDISNKKLRAFLYKKLKQYNLKNKVVLEIVESESINNYNDFFTFAKEVKEFGCKIAIDDFGSGYSNFDYIIKLSEYIDYLKIDGSLVKNITTDSKVQILIGSLKFLCDNLRVETIAEYVEDETTLKYIQSIGIDYSQGYYIGKPSPQILQSNKIDL